MKPDQQISPDTLLIALLTLIFPIIHNAQSSSESVYSDQTFDPISVTPWYADPFIWGGILILALIAVLWYRRRR